jgi:hypothetical protein
MERLDVLANSLVSPFDGVNVCLDGTPNSKQVTQGHGAKIISRAVLKCGVTCKPVKGHSGGGGPKRLSSLSGRSIIHPKKSSLGRQTSIFDEGSNSKAHILSKINPFSSQNGF